MATPGTSLQGGPSSCTGQVTSHGTPWCTPGCDDKSFEGWPQGSLQPSLSLFFCSLGTVKPVKMPGRPGSQLIHTFKAAPDPPDISALGWIVQPQEPQPHSPTGTAKSRIQFGPWEVPFLTPGPQNQPTKPLYVCSTSPWRIDHGGFGWMVRQSATPAQGLRLRYSTWSQWRWQPQWLTTHCRGSLEASCFRFLKLENINLLLFFPLQI